METFESLELQHAAERERTKLKESKRRLRSTNSTSRRRKRNLKDKTRKKTQLQAVAKTFKTDEDAVRKSPRKKLSLLFSKRKNSKPDSPVAKPKSKCILNDDVERQIRREWVVGSCCQIYSRSRAKWLDGKIVKTFVDQLGEWLQVEYCQLKTQIQRYCVHIRPLPQKKEKKPEKCGPEIATFFTVESSSSDEIEKPEESALELEESVELEEYSALEQLSDILKVEALGMVQEESKKSLPEPEPKAPAPEACVLETSFRLCGSKFNTELSFEESKQNVENFVAESPNDEHLQLIKEHMEKSLPEPEPKAPVPEAFALETLFRLCGSKFNSELSLEEYKQNVENFVAESPNDEHLQLLIKEHMEKSLPEPEPKAPVPAACALETLFRLCGSEFNAELLFEEYKQNVENFVAESPNDEHLQLLIKEYMENFEVPELVQMPEKCISLLLCH